MTDKEEKVIKNFKDILEDNPEQITLYNLGIQDLRIIMNLIEKLQKENEDLKEAYDNCFEVASETRRDLINQLADCQEYIDYINNEEMDNLWEENLNM